MVCPPLTLCRHLAAFSGPPARQTGAAHRLRLRRGELGARLAWIGIDAEHEEFGRQRAEIDRAADQRLREPRRRPGAGSRLAGVAAPAGGAKTRSTASSISFSIGSSVTTQVCPTMALTCPPTATRGALLGEIEDRDKPRQLAQAGELGDCPARLRLAPRSPYAARRRRYRRRRPERSRRDCCLFISVEPLAGGSAGRIGEAHLTASERCGVLAHADHGAPGAYRPLDSRGAASSPKGRP